MVAVGTYQAGAWPTAGALRLCDRELFKRQPWDRASLGARTSALYFTCSWHVKRRAPCAFGVQWALPLVQI